MHTTNFSAISRANLRWYFCRHVGHVSHGSIKSASAPLVDVDVMMSGLVPFLLCPLLQGPCVGPLSPEANFLRRTSSTWRTGTNTSIGPGSRQPCWRTSCHPFKHALTRAPSGVTGSHRVEAHKVASHQMGGCPPSSGPTRFPPIPAPWQPFASDPKHLAS